MTNSHGQRTRADLSALGGLGKGATNRGLHIQAGQPAQNAYIEPFNRTYPEEILDAYMFDSLDEVRSITDQWLEACNAIRPPEAVQGLSLRRPPSTGVCASQRALGHFSAACSSDRERESTSP